MTYKELLQKLVAFEGPCLRLCAYCSEFFETAEVKECVEGLVKELYQVRQERDRLEEENQTLRKHSEELINNEDRNPADGRL